MTEGRRTVRRGGATWELYLTTRTFICLKRWLCLLCVSRTGSVARTRLHRWRTRPIWNAGPSQRVVDQ
jgi:hypothetical protein